MATERRAQCDAVVARFRELEFHPNLAVLEFLHRQQVTPFTFFTANIAVYDLVAVLCALPVAEVFSVDLLNKSIGITFGEFFVCFFGADLADIHIAPANLAAVGLQLDRAFGECRIFHPAVGHFFLIRLVAFLLFSVSEVAGLFIGEEVLEHRVVDHGLAVEDDGDTFTDHPDFKLVPLAKGLVHFLVRVFAGSALAVIPEATRTFGPTETLRVGLGRIPNLHLRDAAEIHPAVSCGQCLVFDPKLEVAVILVGREIEPLAIIDQLSVLRTPMGVDVIP